MFIISLLLFPISVYSITDSSHHYCWGMAKKTVAATQPQPTSSAKGRKRKTTENSTEPKATGINVPASRTYASWTEDEGRLLDWLEEPDNYDLYKGTGKVSSLTGKINTTGTTKESIYRTVAAYLQQFGSARTHLTVKNKFRDLEKAYKKALAYLTQTGSGCHNPDAEKIEEKMASNRGEFSFVTCTDALRHTT